MLKRIAAFLSQPVVITILRLSLFSLYGIVIIGQDLINFQRHENTALWVCAIALWSLLLVDYIRRIRMADNKRAFLLSNLGYPIFLLTGALIPIDHPWIVAVPLILGYALQLRELAAGHAMTYSLALVIFILIISSMVLYLVERDEPQTNFTSPGTALSYAIARLFRIYGTNTATPATEPGQEIAYVMGVAALVAAGLFTGQIIRWLVRPADEKAKVQADEPASRVSAEEFAALRGEVARMSAQLDRVSELLERPDRRMSKE